MSEIKARLIPEVLRRSEMLWWTNIVPQIILFFIHLRVYGLIREEMDHTQQYLAVGIGMAQLALMGLTLCVWRYLATHKKELSGLSSGVLLAAHTAYLWFIASNLGQMIPSPIEDWIVDQGQLMLYEFTFMMPGLFYAAFCLACFSSRLSYGGDVAATAGLMVGAPLLYYLIFMGIGRVLRGEHGIHFPEVIVISFFVGLTTVMFLAVIRLVGLVMYGLRHRPPVWHMGLAVLIALIGPIAGLILNRQIPFPVDFQSAGVYVMTVINGLIVLLPRREGRHMPALLFARSTTYPFSLYFFLVFLPFLPLALLAIIAVGLGFLILTPVVLFLFHTKCLYDDFQMTRRQAGNGLALGAVGLGVFLLPGIFCGQAVYDKVVLRRAIDYVYAPDYQRDVIFNGSVWAVKQALIKLRDFKDGVQWPYLSGIYNQYVFNGMVLPDSKMNQMYQLFAGEDLPERKSGRFRGGDFFPGRRALRGRITTRDRQVDLVNVTSVSLGQDRGIGASKIRLEMVNKGESDTAEFVAELTIPQGVLVSGFSLKVGEDMVPGQIFERSAALWVYQMIVSRTRRDPGLLMYQSPTQLSLNVYPFTKGESRIVEIELTYPVSLHPVVQVGDRKMVLLPDDEGASPTKTPSIMIAEGRDSVFLLIPPQVLAELPPLQREPYFHFIVDASQNTGLTDDEFAGAVEHFMGQAFWQGDICLTNFEVKCSLSTKNPDRLPLRGDFVPERAIKKILLDYQTKMKKVKNSIWDTYPVFVIVTPRENFELNETDLAYFKDILAEFQYVVWSSQGDQATGKAMTLSAPSVALLKYGSHIVSVSTDQAGSQLIRVSPKEKVKELTYYHPEKKNFEPYPQIQFLDLHLPYVQGIELHLANQEMIRHPFLQAERLPGLIEESRRLAVLIPAVSFIVVERSSQWNIMKEKERQRLKAGAGLEFEEDFETPAPPLWFLLGGMALLLAMVRTGKLRANLLR
jgi:hypothetical protein